MPQKHSHTSTDSRIAASNRCALGARRFNRVRVMSKEKFGIAVDDEINDELDELVDKCDDLNASRSEVVEASLTAYLRADTDQIKRVRELVIRRRKGKL